jgi:DNA replication ATP-dependent helicase Dna2
MSQIPGVGSETTAPGSLHTIYAQILGKVEEQVSSHVSDYIIYCFDIDKHEPFEYKITLEANSIDLKQNVLFQAWEGAYINFVNTAICTSDRSHFIHHPDTIIVLEPDYLIDASAIAECFMDRTDNPNLFFFQRCLPNPTSPSMINGIFVNQLLDAYLEEDDPSFQDVFRKTLIANVFTALFMGAGELNLLRRKVTDEHLPVINRVSELWKDKQKTLEPSYISIDYGLQGRLDVLLEETNDNVSQFSNREIPDNGINTVPRDIVELKSSKARDADVWTNHRMQVVCYHLLLRSVYGNQRQGNNYILYSRASNNPLRQVPTLALWENQVIIVRNAILLKIHNLAFKSGSLLALNVENFGEFPIFKKDELIEFQKLVRELSPLEYAYLDNFVQFLFRELWHTKVGMSNHQNINSTGFSALWRLPRKEKKKDFTIMDGLTFNAIEGNHVTLQIHLQGDVTNFRKGDIVILYPDCEDEKYLLKDQIRKGFIVELTNTQLILQMKNIKSLQNVLLSYTSWVIEHDFMESGTFNMIRGMFNFMKGENRKRELILGLIPPKSILVKQSHLDDETETIINKALAAQDYFLLQGPPGTGKTSRILTSLVSRILADSLEHMMIIAFTNRAVDEICERLEQNDIGYIRLGNGSNPEYHYLSQVIQTKTFREIEELISTSRVFVSTVASFLSQYQELLRVKSFDTLFVDEASQLLEPHLAGIMIHFKRFFLIGDQNQLPAIVTQEEDELLSGNNLLSDHGFHSMHESLFERLFRRCISQRWDHACDMLTNHYRMHIEIQALVNPFYSNRLMANSKRQTAEWKQMNSIGERIDEILAGSRVIFLAVTTNKQFKRSRKEAKLVSLMLQSILRQCNNSVGKQKVGVITTWRAQINEIVAQLTDETLLQNVTVDTVERFQGSERDIIIFSTALSAPDQMKIIQSLSPDCSVDRKLNVAISRAREQFILIGNPVILEQSLHYRRVIDYIKSVGGYYNENWECVVEHDTDPTVCVE